MTAILKRELSAYFASPIGYIFIAVFYVFAGFFFDFYCIYYDSSDVSGIYTYMLFITIFLIPILTMRLMSEDRKNKTDQALLTAPIGLVSLVLGKVLAAACIYLLSLGIMLVFSIVIAAFTTPNWALILCNFLGLFLLGFSVICIGTFISSLTENQVIAAVGGFAVAFALMLLDSLALVMPNQFLSNLVTNISFFSRYDNFTLGLLSFADIVFFVSVSALFIFFTVRVLEKRRWA